MKLLIIDDEPAIVEVLIARIAAAGMTLEHSSAASHASALAAMETNDIDLIVCDLRMPTVDGALDADVMHGTAIYGKARATMPGTPVIVLSAYGDDQTVADMLQLSPHDDPFGTGSTLPMLQYAVKTPDLADCVGKIRIAYDGLQSLESVDLSPDPEDLEIPASASRVMKIFGRRRKAAVVRFATIDGGLSDARVFRVRAEDHQGALAGLAVGKIASVDEVNDENDRYERYIVALLPQTIFTIRVMMVRTGAADTGGIFYTLEEAYDHSLFDLVANLPSVAAACVEALQSGTVAWRGDRPTRQMTVGEIRRLSLPDNRITELVEERLAGFRWQELEERVVTARLCPQHCDLHGLNVIASEAGGARLIDYGLVAEAPAALDPVTLELSPIFHKKGPAFGNEWPTVSDCEQWVHRKKFVDSAPFPEYLHKCRAWSFGEAGSNAEVFATTYAYVARQLAYPETNVERARGIIQACHDALS